MNNYNYFNEFNETFPNQNFSNFNITQQNNNNMLFGPYEGFIKGNMFKNIYEQYKNYQPIQLIPKNEQEEALLNLNQMQFAMHELNLYLDVFPNDTNAMTQFISFRNNYNRLLMDYENKYGAINVNSTVLNTTPFGWSTTPWPWNRRDS